MVTAALRKFMEQHAGIFSNHHSVEFGSGYEDSITVACTWPGQEDEQEYCLELLFEASTFEQFIETFHLKHLSDLYNIQPQHLLDLFNRQKACVNCTINDRKSFGLIIEKRDAYIQATADPGGAVHAIQEDLNGPDAYKHYTFSYFKDASN